MLISLTPEEADFIVFDDVGTPHLILTPDSNEDEACPPRGAPQVGLLYSFKATPAALRLSLILIGKEGANGMCDLVQWQYHVAGSNLVGRFRHTPDHARRFILRDGLPSQAMQLEQTLSTVATHPGQKHGNPRLWPVPGHAPKEHIDRWPVAQRSWFDRVMQPLVRSYDQMIVGTGKKDLFLGHGHLFHDQLDFPSRLLAQPLTEPWCECGIHVLDDHDRGLQGHGKLGKDLRQGERAARRRSQENKRMKVRSPAPAWEPVSRTILSLRVNGVFPISLPITSILRKSS